MPSDLIFDFFGTLVEYNAGTFHTAPYERTHAFLVDQGFTIDYPRFEKRYQEISAALETNAKKTALEYHMDDVARVFFFETFAVNASRAVIQEFVKHFIAEWGRGIRYLDGIQDFLGELASKYRLTVLSNTHYPDLIHGHLAQMEVARYFSHIVTSVEYGRRKPHPSIFQKTLADLDIPPHQALYIGDTYVDDYEGATSAGIRPILIDPKNTYPHIADRITSLFNLRDFLKI